MNILVTGAAGFIGFHLTKELLRQGHRVRGLLLPVEAAEPLNALGVEIFRGDLTRPDSLEAVGKNMDIVFHLAARTSDWGTQKQFEAIMVDGTRNILRACRQDISRFIYCSSIAALGLGRKLAGLDETAPRKICGVPYCDTKIMAEDLVVGFCRDNKITYTVVRPANVIGPGSVWVKEILDAFKRGPMPLFSSGRAPGAFVYIDNLVDGIIRAGLSKAAAGRIYHFRDEYPITWGQYLNTVGSWIEKKTFGSLPARLAWSLGAFAETLLIPLSIRPPITRLAVGVMGWDNSVDTCRARTELGWEPRITQEEAMNRIKEWVESSYIQGRV